MPDNQTIEVIKAVGAVVTPIILAWITYLQIKSGKKQDIIHKEMNGMKSELVEAVKGRAQAEGEIKGAADAKQESKPVTDVNIVDQTKPVDVTQIKK